MDQFRAPQRHGISRSGAEFECTAERRLMGDESPASYAVHLCNALGLGTTLPLSYRACTPRPLSFTHELISHPLLRPSRPEIKNDASKRLKNQMNQITHVY